MVRLGEELGCMAQPISLPGNKFRPLRDAPSQTYLCAFLLLSDAKLRKGRWIPLLSLPWRPKRSFSSWRRTSRMAANAHEGSCCHLAHRRHADVGPGEKSERGESERCSQLGCVVELSRCCKGSV